MLQTRARLAEDVVIGASLTEYPASVPQPNVMEIPQSDVYADKPARMFPHVLADLRRDAAALPHRSPLNVAMRMQTTWVSFTTGALIVTVTSEPVADFALIKTAPAPDVLTVQRTFEPAPPVGRPILTVFDVVPMATVKTRAVPTLSTKPSARLVLISFADMVGAVTLVAENSPCRLVGSVELLLASRISGSPKTSAWPGRGSESGAGRPPPPAGGSRCGTSWRAPSGLSCSFLGCGDISIRDSHEQS